MDAASAESEVQRSWRPLIAIALSMVMMYITSFGINVLIGQIVTDLPTTVAQLQMVIVAASLIAGSLMVTAGRLADKFGKKKIFVTGIAIYSIGLLVVVLSPNASVFTIGWAVIWPTGMVLVIPTSIALIMYFYQGTQRAVAFGVYGAVLSAVSALAPVIVGLLANLLGWRLALSLSPAFGLIALLVGFSLPETKKDGSVRIDLVSVVLSVLSFGLFLITTTSAAQYGWFFEKRPLLIGGAEIDLFGLSVVPWLYALSAILLVLFFQRGVLLRRRGQTPLLDARLLQNIPFTLGMLIGGLFFLVNAGAIFAISVFLQAGAKFDPLQTALTTLPFTAGVAALSFTTPRLANYLAPKWIIVLGSLITAIGLWLAGSWASVAMTPMDLLLPMLLAGVGSGLIMAQVATVTMSTVPPEQSGEASGLSETVKEIIGQGFAIAFTGAVLFGAVYGSMVDSYAEREGLSLSEAERAEIVVELEDIFQSITEPEEAAFVATLPENTRQAYGQIVNQAAETGLEAALLAMNAVLALVLLLALFLPGRRTQQVS